MRPITLPTLLALACLASGLRAEALHPSTLTYPQLEFRPLTPQRFTTRQGITLVVMEDHELPTVNLSLMLRAGDSLDPPEKVGMAELTAEVMRTGGAGEWTGDQLDEVLDNAAVSLGWSTRVESALGQGRCLTRNLDLLLRALRAQLMEPRFAADKVEVARQAMFEALRRQNDEPGPIARRELKKIVYGSRTPWARTPTKAGVASITRDDLVDFHRRYYRPNHLLIGISGDVVGEEIRQRIERLFEGWQKGQVPDLPAPTEQAPQPGVYLVRKDLNQTTVRMGHLGLPLHHPDYHACQVMNRILGLGTFTSRMGIEIRSNRGLAYSVGSGIFQGRGPSMFIAIAQTKAASTHEVVGLMREIIAGMSSGDLTEKEMADAKKTLLNQWVFEFEKSEKIVDQKVEHVFYQFPDDFLEQYPAKIAAVTREDVLRCAREHLRPQDLAVFLVGSPEQMGRPLAELGTVTEVPLEQVE